MFGQHRKRRKERNRAQAQLAHEQGVQVEDIKKQRHDLGQNRGEFLKQAISQGKGRRGFEKLRNDKEEFSNEKNLYETQKPVFEQEVEDLKSDAVKRSMEEGREIRRKGREEGRQSAREFLTKPPPEGLDPEKRKALQYEANKGIQRGMQAAHRKLLGEQSQRGISGRSGIGYAQQADLFKKADEAKGGVQRDLTKIDSDLALKKQAAELAYGEGEAAQSLLDKQLAIDEMNLKSEKQRQRMLEDQIYRQFNRV